MINHFDLCKKTAEWAIKYNHVVLFDYQSYSTGEFPDCLAFDGAFSSLYEIKVSRADFLGDAKKECRQRTIKILERSYFWEVKPTAKASDFYSRYQVIARDQEKPHLGLRRYYVCPPKLILPEETGAWGLIWVAGNRFYTKKKSLKFKNSYHSERAILVHALRKQKNTNNDRVLVKPY